MSSKNALLAIILVALMIVGAQFLYNMQSGTVGQASKADIEKVVKNYILKNPQIIEEAMILRRRDQQAQLEKSRLKAIQDNSEKLFKASHDFVGGNPNGDVTIVEFFDYNCGFCRRAFKDIQTVIEKDKNVRVVFKELPIFGDQSIQAAKAALASIKQNKYFEFHRDMLIEDGRANEAKALKIAEKLGLDVEKLKADMKDPDVEKAIEANSDLANDIGLEGTPLYVVGDQIINGAPEDLAEQILNKVKTIRAARKNKT